MATGKHAPYNKIRKSYPVFLEWRTGKVEMCFVEDKDESGVTFKTVSGTVMKLPRRTFGYVWRCWFFKPTEEQQGSDPWRHT